jgi:uncharacterized protein (DUF58 family)
VPVEVHLRLKNRLLPILVVLVGLIRIFDSYAGWTVLLITLAGLWLICWLWARSLARNLRLHRQVRYGWVQVGDRLEDRFSLVNQSIFPALWVEVLDHSNLPGYKASCATGVGGSRENSWISEGTCTQRGLFTHGPTSLLTGDPFGIYVVEIFHPHSVSLLVAPPVGKLDRLFFPPGGWSGEGSPRSRALEKTVSSAGVRPYLPGDQLRWIHWPTSARHSALYTRIFDGIPAGEWWIVLDLAESSQAGNGEDSTLEHAIILAASLASLGIRQGKPVGLAVNGDQPDWLTPRVGEGQRLDIFRTLALAEGGGCAFDHFLTSMAPLRSLKKSTILITSDLTLSWLKPLLRPGWAGNSLTVLLLNPAEYLPEPGEDVMKRAEVCQQTLLQFGITSHVVNRNWFDQPEFRPGKRGSQQFRITPRGRAVLVTPASDQEWKPLW